MQVIIIGAGPTGLTAGLLLARCGVHVDIIDKKMAGSTLSRAVGINPCSLKILEASGVTKRLIDEGILYRDAYFYHGKEAFAHLHLDAASPVQYGYNFMLGLPQDRTELVLTEAFEASGGRLHYDTCFESLVDNGQHVTVTCTNGKVFQGDYALGADGAHAAVRECIGIPSKGFTLPEAWSIADIESADERIHRKGVSLFLLPDGALAFIAPIGDTRLRLVSNTPSALKSLPLDTHPTVIHREGQFQITIAQVEQYQKGRVFLAGDAAHTHSPAGGRGMNLGISDAADFVEKLLEGTLADYTKNRYTYGKKMIGGSEQLRKMLTSHSQLKRAAFLFGLACASRVSFLEKKLVSQFLYG